MQAYYKSIIYIFTKVGIRPDWPASVLRYLPVASLAEYTTQNM